MSSTATKTLTQKVRRLEKRMEHIEMRMHISPATPIEQLRKSSNGLRKLASLWVKKPRTRRDLASIRKQLWNE